MKTTNVKYRFSFTAGADYYHEHLGFSLVEFLNQQAPCTVGTKKDLLNKTGRSKNTLTVLYNNEDINIPLAAFTTSSVFTLLNSF